MGVRVRTKVGVAVSDRFCMLSLETDVMAEASSSGNKNREN